MFEGGLKIANNTLRNSSIFNLQSRDKNFYLG